MNPIIDDIENLYSLRPSASIASSPSRPAREVKSASAWDEQEEFIEVPQRTSHPRSATPVESMPAQQRSPQRPQQPQQPKTPTLKPLKSLKTFKLQGLKFNPEFAILEIATLRSFFVSSLLLYFKPSLFPVVPWLYPSAIALITMTAIPAVLCFLFNNKAISLNVICFYFSYVLATLIF